MDLPYRAEVNAGESTVPDRCGRFTLVNLPYRAEVNAGESTVPGRFMSRSKSVPRESLEVYTNSPSFSYVGPGFINSNNHE